MTVLGLGLAELQNRIDEVKKPQRRLMHHPDFTGLVSGQPRVRLHILQRSENQGERCTQLMGYIGEETQLFGVEFLLMHTVFTLKRQVILQVQTLAVEPHTEPEQSHRQQQIQELGIPGGPHRRPHLERQHRNGILRLVRHRSPENKPILPGRKVTHQDSAFGSGRIPAVIDSLDII